MLLCDEFLISHIDFILLSYQPLLTAFSIESGSAVAKVSELTQMRVSSRLSR